MTPGTLGLTHHHEIVPPPSRSEGLILIAIGAESIRPVVEKSLASLNLAQAKVLVDFTVSEYVEADPLSWEAGAKQVRNLLKDAIEEPTSERLHLFYRGPVAIAPLVGAVIASSTKPLLVYHYQEGHYVLAYTMDRRFLIAKD